MPRIVVLGAGFAGLWAALGAARKRDEIGALQRMSKYSSSTAIPTTISGFATMRSTSARRRYRLLKCLTRSGSITGLPRSRVDPVKQQSVSRRTWQRGHRYDRLVLALGSQLVRPEIPGLASNGFDVDTYAAAVRFEAHLAALGKQADWRALPRLFRGRRLYRHRSRNGMPGKLEKAGSPATLALFSSIPIPWLANLGRTRARSSAKRWRRWVWRRGSTQGLWRRRKPSRSAPVR